MANSRTAIANQALLMVNREEVQTIDQPESKTERTVAAFFNDVYEEVLTDFPWNFCTKVEQLPETLETPIDSYSHSFAIPNAPKCLRVISLENVGFTDPTWERRGDVLYLNSDECFIKYIYKVTDTRKIPAHVVRCIATLLASRIAVPLLGTEGSGLASYYQQMYSQEVKPNATFIDANEGKNPVIEESTVLGGYWADGRFYSGGGDYNHSFVDVSGGFGTY